MHNNQQPRPNSEAVAASFGIPHCGAILAGEAAAGEGDSGTRFCPWGIAGSGDLGREGFAADIKLRLLLGVSPEMTTASVF